jgi:hypothetical protein
VSSYQVTSRTRMHAKWTDTQTGIVCKSYAHASTLITSQSPPLERVFDAGQKNTYFYFRMKDTLCTTILCTTQQYNSSWCLASASREKQQQQQQQRSNTSNTN